MSIKSKHPKMLIRRFQHNWFQSIPSLILARGFKLREYIHEKVSVLQFFKSKCAKTGSKTLLLPAIYKHVKLSAKVVLHDKSKREVVS